MKRISGLAAYLAMASAILSCSADKNLVPERTGDDRTVDLRAWRSHIITRAGDQTTDFGTGTKYALFIHDGAGWIRQCQGTDAAVETADHTIDYGALLTYGDSPLSFYGATYGDTDVVPPVSAGTSGRQLLVKQDIPDDGILPDLMTSRNLIDCTATTGNQLQMDFRHAFCRLNLYVMKQDEEDDEIRQMEDLKLLKVDIAGTRSSGTFDITGGKWVYSESDLSERRTYYTNDAGLAVSVSPESIAPAPDKEGASYIFPNTDGEEVSIVVTLSGMKDEYGKPVTDEGQPEGIVVREFKVRMMDDVSGEDKGPFVFEQNHEYTLVVTVLKDDVRTVAISPQKYDWIDEDINVDNDTPGSDAYMGQPVTFGNQMWMDRNLGAKSADCENDWWNCRGYYYQYGRNIPYMLDMEKYALAITNEEEGGLHLMAFYTYNEKGEKVYGGFQARGYTILPETEIPEGCAATPEGIPVRYPNVAMNPGETGGDGGPLIYNFVYDIDNGGTWLYNENNNSEAPIVNQMWMGSPETHPCPRGWRLPTREDFAAFMPDRTLGSPWNTYFHAPISYYGDITKRPEHLCYGKINEEKAIYIIKNQGRDDCYRIRIIMKETKAADFGELSSEDKHYFEFSYFSGDKTMSFMGLDTEEKFINSDFDWSIPSATMQVPACGFIHPGGGLYLEGDGQDAILRTTDYANASTNWVCYLRNNWQFGLISSSRKALGDQIRCIRDINAL